MTAGFPSVVPTSRLALALAPAMATSLLDNKRWNPRNLADNFSELPARNEHPSRCDMVQASITALHVYTPMFTPVPGLPRPEDRVPEADLKRVQADAAAWLEGASGIDTDVIVDMGQPAAQILRRCKGSRADLIVMGTHGASGFERLLLVGH